MPSRSLELEVVRPALPPALVAVQSALPEQAVRLRVATPSGQVAHLMMEACSWPLPGMCAGSR